MADIKVRDLDTTSSIQNNNSLLALTDEGNNTVKRISFQKLIQNEISSDVDNTLELGTDNKLFVEKAATALTELTDVNIDNVQDGQTLVYDEATQKFINGESQGGGGWYPSILQYFWSDRELNRMDMLRADTFSWQDGTVYSDAYTHLEDDIQGKTLQSETISGVTIQYYLADDGHKICPASQENNIISLYEATGIAWYYILDTDNTRFKLPRTKFGFVGLRDTVGKFVNESLPNITGEIGVQGPDSYRNVTSGSFYSIETGGVDGGSSTTSNYLNKAGFDASRSSSTYQNNAPVQQKSTQMYLYFYVGEYSQTAIEQTAGITSEQLNAKLDIPERYVIAKSDPSLMPSYWVVCNDGWCEQGGEFTSSDITVTFLKEFANNNYIISTSFYDYASPNDGKYSYPQWRDKTVTSVRFQCAYLGSLYVTTVDWKASGYLASGQY